MKHKFIPASWRFTLAVLAGMYTEEIFGPSVWHFIVVCTQNWWRHDGPSRLVTGIVVVALISAYKGYMGWEAAQREAKRQAFYDRVKKRETEQGIV